MIEFAEPIRERQQMLAETREAVNEMIHGVLAGERGFPTDDEIRALVCGVALRSMARRFVREYLREHGAA